MDEHKKSWEQWLRWLCLGAGLVMALVGGSVKLKAVLETPELFEYVFFSGASYLALVCGLVLIVISLGYQLFFGPDEE